jgi:hypothetical protein
VARSQPAQHQILTDCKTAFQQRLRPGPGIAQDNPTAYFHTRRLQTVTGLLETAATPPSQVPTSRPPTAVLGRVSKLGAGSGSTPIQQFAAAGLYPPFPDRVHSRHPNPSEHDLDFRIGQGAIDQLGERAVPIPDQEPRPSPDVPGTETGSGFVDPAVHRRPDRRPVVLRTRQGFRLRSRPEITGRRDARPMTRPAGDGAGPAP